MIPILALLSYNQLNSVFDAEPDLSASRTDLPKLDLSMEKLEPEKNMEYLNFTDPAGKLKLTYSSSWTKTDENTLEEAKKLYDSEAEQLLLFLYKINLSNLQPSYLAIERTAETGWGDIIDTMRQEAEAKSQIMEIVKSDLGKNRISLEITYAPKDGQKNSGTSTHQREEIIISEEESFIVLVLTTEQNWPSIKQEAEDIIGSIEFLETPPEQETRQLRPDINIIEDAGNTDADNADTKETDTQNGNTGSAATPAPLPIEE
jgi:hypothetical protein